MSGIMILLNDDEQRVIRAAVVAIIHDEKIPEAWRNTAIRLGERLSAAQT